MPRHLPVTDQVTREELYADPCPDYARRRKEAPVLFGLARRQAVLGRPSRSARASKEAVWWVAPVDIHPRRPERENVLPNIALSPGLSIASACHDESRSRAAIPSGCPGRVT